MEGVELPAPSQGVRLQRNSLLEHRGRKGHELNSQKLEATSGDHVVRKAQGSGASQQEGCETTKHCYWLIGTWNKNESFECVAS